MLVLSRIVQEEVVISSPMLISPIRVTVIGVAGGKVRLGFEATKDITVDRREVHDRKQKKEGNWPGDRAA